MLTVERLAALVRPNRRSYAEKYCDTLKAVMQKYEITTPLRQAHFLAQVLHESGRLRYNRELASGEAYEGRRDLGNTEPGDGKRFKGRGLIQLTGRSNYRRYAEAIGVDVVGRPELVEALPLTVDVAGWYWQTRGLSALADRDDLKGITRRVNGGYNGLADRTELLSAAKRVLEVV